jgi:hypothetical protein
MPDARGRSWQESKSKRINVEHRTQLQERHKQTKREVDRTAKERRTM